MIRYSRRGGPGTLMRTYYLVSSEVFSSHAWLFTAAGKLFSKQVGIYTRYLNHFKTMHAPAVYILPINPRIVLPPYVGASPPGTVLYNIKLGTVTYGTNEQVFYFFLEM